MSTEERYCINSVKLIKDKIEWILQIMEIV